MTHGGGSVMAWVYVAADGMFSLNVIDVYHDGAAQ